MTDHRPTILIDAAIRFGRPHVKGVSTYRLLAEDGYGGDFDQPA